MVQLFIIADDFTGALDTGVQLSKKGIRTKVITRGEEELTGEAFRKMDDQIQVLVYDSESRHLPAKAAGKIVGDATALAVASGIPYLYKKTDSALRGNIGAELTAMLENSREEELAFVSAFPKMNRGTENGIHYIGNVPVGESVFAADPFNPVKYSRVSEIIKEQSDAKVRNISAAQWMPWKNGITVFDARTQEDLKGIAQVLKADGSVHIMAGCAGFAEELPELLGLCEKEVKLPRAGQKMTVFCGSINPITQRQIKAAEANGFTRICIRPEEKLAADFWVDGHTEPLQRYLKAGKECSYMVIDSNDEDVVMEEEGKRLIAEWKLSVEEVRSRISTSLGQLMKEMYKRLDLGLVMITGGDTLFQCMKQLEVTEMEPIGEIFPGVVLARFHYCNEERYVITKSGGFGEETLLLDIVEWLKKED